MAENLDIEGLIPSWVLHLTAERKAPGTIKGYQERAVWYTAWCTANDLPTNLDRRQVTRWVAELLGSGLSPYTVQSRLAALKSLSRWCAAEEEIPADQLKDLVPPRGGKRMRLPFSDSDVEKLLATCEANTFAGKRDSALIRLMVDSGGRASEIVNLSMADVSALTGRAMVTGKGDKDRQVPFGPDTARAIDRYIRERRKHKHAASTDLWLGVHMPGFGYKALWEMLKRRGAVAGVGQVNPHRFRRTFAHNWLDAGGSADGLMSLAGWTTMDMVRHYTEAFRSERALEEHQRLFGK
jgi:integrase/recombinase XerD